MTFHETKRLKEVEVSNAALQSFFKWVKIRANYQAETPMAEFVSCLVQRPMEHIREKKLQAHINIHLKLLKKKRRSTKEFTQTAPKDPLAPVVTKCHQTSDKTSASKCINLNLNNAQITCNVPVVRKHTRKEKYKKIQV